jgi:ABC-type phosphate/phosphonate transport system permease subunit
MTLPDKCKKRYSPRDEILVKLFLLVAWPPMSVLLLFSVVIMFLGVFLSIPFCRVYEEEGKLSIKLPGFSKG